MPSIRGRMMRQGLPPPAPPVPRLRCGWHLVARAFALRRRDTHYLRCWQARMCRQAGANVLLATTRRIRVCLSRAVVGGNVTPDYAVPGCDLRKQARNQRSALSPGPMSSTTISSSFPRRPGAPGRLRALPCFVDDQYRSGSPRRPVTYPSRSSRTVSVPAYARQQVLRPRPGSRPRHVRRSSSSSCVGISVACLGCGLGTSSPATSASPGRHRGERARAFSE